MEAMMAEETELERLRRENGELMHDNAEFEAMNNALEAETRWWAWATAGISSFTIAVLIFNILFGTIFPPMEEDPAPETNAPTETELESANLSPLK